MIGLVSEGADCQITIEVRDLDKLITTNDLNQLDIFITDSLAEKFLVTIFDCCVDLLSIEDDISHENIH